jgi:aminopeptidase N
LVRFYYNDKEDMFDAVSYNKGGRILHMLRAYVGDSAFFKSMNNYLTTNKFKSAEAHQLRLAFEEVTGKDLNWFFNQWYFGHGHPKLDIAYSYDEAAKKAKVVVRQTGDSLNLFRLPVAIDVYEGSNRTRHNVWVQNGVDSFVFAAQRKPELINFDADKILLAEKKESKTLEEYAFQYRNARNFMDRREALAAALKKQEEQKAVEIIMQALNDSYSGLRIMAINGLDLRKQALKTLAEEPLYKLAQEDKKRLVKAAAIAKLGEYGFAKYTTMFKTAIDDSSYSVAGAALNALATVDSTQAYTEAKRLAQAPIKGGLAQAVTSIMIRFGDESSADVILANFENMPISQEKLEGLAPFTQYLAKLQDLTKFKRGIDAVANFTDEIPAQYRSQLSGYIENMMRQVQQKKTAAGQKEHADYVAGKIAAQKQKAF